MWQVLQRVFRRGPKYGIARGVAVLTAKDSDTSSLPLVLRPTSSFRSWAADQGVTLDDSPESLDAVEARLDDWQASEMGPRLNNEVGLYLGAVIVAHVPGARWVVWPNGHPVVRLASGKEVDTTAIVRERLSTGAPSLTSVLAKAHEAHD